jgi:hypothetical protein
MKKAIFWITRTNIGRLISCVILSAISLFIANYYDFMVWVALGFFVIFPLPYFLVSMVYAWILNPIRERREMEEIRKAIADLKVWVENKEDKDLYTSKLSHLYSLNVKKMKPLSEYKDVKSLIKDLSNYCKL